MFQSFVGLRTLLPTTLVGQVEQLMVCVSRQMTFDLLTLLEVKGHNLPKVKGIPTYVVRTTYMSL